MNTLFTLSLALLCLAAGHAGAATIDSRLVLTVVDRSAGSKIIKSFFAAIGEETLEVTADPRCESPEAVALQGTEKKRVGGVYVYCSEPVKRQSLVFTVCDGLSENCRTLWSGERSYFESNVDVRCRAFDTPGISDFIFGTDAYRLDPTIRDFCRNSISPARDALIEKVRALGTIVETQEVVFGAYSGSEDFFERFMTYRDPVGDFLLNAQEFFQH